MSGERITYNEDGTANIILTKSGDSNERDNAECI